MVANGCLGAPKVCIAWIRAATCRRDSVSWPAILGDGCNSVIAIVENCEQLPSFGYVLYVEMDAVFCVLETLLVWLPRGITPDKLEAPRSFFYVATHLGNLYVDEKNPQTSGGSTRSRAFANLLTAPLTYP